MGHYKLDLPYPKIEVSFICPEYGYMLLSNIGSHNSEVSAISLYTYNNMLHKVIIKKYQIRFMRLVSLRCTI